MDDAMAVYKAILKTTNSKHIAIFGTSTGGGMTLAMVLRAKAEGLRIPAAIAPGTPWSDMTKTGDSYFTNDRIDNVLVSNEGWLGDAAKLYANGHDLKDPMLSPVYGDLRGFPPTILTTGTRDLFLSNTVRVHQKLREAGVVADLLVFEGMSHAQYNLAPDAPESKEHFKQVAAFRALSQGIGVVRSRHLGPGWFGRLGRTFGAKEFVWTWHLSRCRPDHQRVRCWG